MVEIITDLRNVPVKRAKMIEVPKEGPRITGTPGDESIIYTELIVPDSLNRRFLNRCGVDIRNFEPGLTKKQVKERIVQTNQEKNLYLRFAGNKPLAVVTDKFEEKNPVKLIRNATMILGTQPVIRYFRGTESLHVNFPLNNGFDGMHLVMNTGKFGVYGGSGSDSIKYGLGWFNAVCSNWTLFLGEALQSSMKRIIHRKKSTSLDDQLIDLLTISQDVAEKIEQSKGKYLTQDELVQYFTAYNQRGLNKKISDQIIAEAPRRKNVFEIAYRLTELCQHEIADSSRARVEYVAGELILCYDQIKANIRGNQPNQQRHPLVEPRRKFKPLNYISAR